MSEKDLIEKIELLREIKPSEEWVISLRSRLAFRMEMERKKDILNKDIFALRELFSFWGNYRGNRTDRTHGANWIYKLAVSLGIVVLVLGGGVLSAFASLKSLPGSRLYPLKIALERARVLVATSEDSKAKLQSEIAVRRIDELKAVVAIVEPAEQKKDRVEQAMDNIQEQLTIAGGQLAKAGDTAEPQKAVAAARAVSEKAGRVEKVLSQVKSSLSGDLGDKLAQTAAVADKTSTKALEVMVNNQDKDSSVDKKEILAKIGEKIAIAQAEIKTVEEKARQATSTAADKVGIMAVLIKDQSDKAQELLDKASESLDKENAPEALNTVKVAKEIIRAAENIADSKSAMDLMDSQKTAENATTTK